MLDHCFYTPNCMTIACPGSRCNGSAVEKSTVSHRLTTTLRASRVSEGRMRKSKIQLQNAAFFALMIGLAQAFMPSPPADRTLIYVLDDQNKLAPLAVEKGRTPLRADVVATGEKLSY